MHLKKVKYSNLNSRQKEIHNFQKLAAILADYGFNCIKLSDDWNGADFLAYHYGGVETLRVQLKGRLTIKKEYEGKSLYMAFPIYKKWYLIQHDVLVKLVGENTNWLNTKSWKSAGAYSSAKPSKKLIEMLELNLLE